MSISSAVTFRAATVTRAPLILKYTGASAAMNISDASFSAINLNKGEKSIKLYQKPYDLLSSTGANPASFATLLASRAWR